MQIDYDQAAEAYARNRAIHPGVFQELLGGGIGTASRVLEVGSGTGNYIIALQQASGCAACGVDPSEGMLAQARQRASAVQFSQGRAEALPFADSSFDLVYSVDVIHHVADRAAAYREAFRALEPGGWVCTVTDSEDIIRRREPLSNYFPETVPVELRRYPPIADLRALMTAAGFSDLREVEVVLTSTITDSRPYRERAHSSLHLVDDAAFQRGLARLEADLRRGPVRKVSLYLLLWGRVAPPKVGRAAPPKAGRVAPPKVGRVAPPKAGRVAPPKVGRVAKHSEPRHNALSEGGGEGEAPAQGGLA